MPFEEALRQQELGEQVLLLRPIIDDGDGPRLVRPTLQPPFRKEHPPDGGLKLAEQRRAHRVLGFAAAGGLGAREEGVQEAPPALVFTSMSLGPSAPRWKS